MSTSMLAGVVVGQPEEEEEEDLGLFTKIKHKIAEYDRGVIVDFDGNVTSGDPEEGEYLEAEVEIEPTEKGVIADVVAGDFATTLELAQEPPEIGLFVTFDSETIGVLIDSAGNVTEFGGTPDDVAEKGVIVDIILEGIGTTPGIAALTVEEADGGPVIE